MSRRYRSEPIEAVVGEDGAPVRFRWRGRRYVVRAVMATWVESVPWWPRETRGGRGSGQRDAWRVEAAAATGVVGVYELYRIHGRPGADAAAVDIESWVLLRVLD